MNALINSVCVNMKNDDNGKPYLVYEIDGKYCSNFPFRHFMSTTRGEIVAATINQMLDDGITEVDLREWKSTPRGGFWDGGVVTLRRDMGSFNWWRGETAFARFMNLANEMGYQSTIKYDTVVKQWADELLSKIPEELRELHRHQTIGHW